jgi:nucleotide-binding universal stress UspA family protein
VYRHHRQNGLVGEVGKMNWMLTTIVVPSDGSAAAEVQLTSARALARATGARIVVAHVDELVRGHMGTHPLHVGEEVLAASVRQQVDALRGAGVRAELQITASSAEVARAITDLATRCNADLIVTRKSRRSPLMGLLFGNVSRRLVRLANCPVLVVS